MIHIQMRGIGYSHFHSQRLISQYMYINDSKGKNDKKTSFCNDTNGFCAFALHFNLEDCSV